MTDSGKELIRLFISQPMFGRDDDILKERSEIARLFEKQYGYRVEVIDSFTKTHDEIIKGRIYMLGGSVSLMYNADYVIFAPGWWRSKGCRIEHAVAVTYDLRRKYLFLGKLLSF